MTQPAARITVRHGRAARAGECRRPRGG